MSTKLDLDTLVPHIQELLNNATKSFPFTLRVDRDAIRPDEEDWYYVVVAPDKGEVRAYDYVETLEIVENQLRAEGCEKIILVPALPD